MKQANDALNLLTDIAKKHEDQLSEIAEATADMVAAGLDLLKGINTSYALIADIRVAIERLKEAKRDGA